MILKPMEDFQPMANRFLFDSKTPDGAKLPGGNALAFDWRLIRGQSINKVSSMLAALTAIALICGLEQPLPYRLLVIVGSIYVIVRHRANIQRLLAGTEPRLGKVV